MSRAVAVLFLALLLAMFPAEPGQGPQAAPGDWSIRREWMTTFYELREVKAR